jgi:hypothetical protein
MSYRASRKGTLIAGQSSQLRKEILLNLIILTLLVIAQPILSVFIINMCVYNIAKLKRNLLLSRCLAKLAVCDDNNLILRLLCHNETRKRKHELHMYVCVCVYAYTYTYIANQ